MRNAYIDTTAVMDALRFVEKNTGRPISVSLNRAGKTFVIGAKGVQGAMQLTPKASKAAIAAVSKKKVGAYVAAQLRKKGQVVGRRKGDRAGIQRNAQGHYVKGSGKIAYASGAISGSDFKALVKKEISRRKRAAGYTAYAGWSNAAKAFGARGVKGVGGSAKKETRHGFGKKADTKHLIAELVNTAPAIETIGIGPAQQVLNNTAKDLMDYANRKIQEVLTKVQA